MPRRSASLITNPSAGGIASRRSARIDRFCAKLVENDVDVSILETRGPGDARELALEAIRSGTTDIVVHGGDGTVNEALQGIVGSGVRFAVWPGGTANVLAGQIGMPAEPAAAAEVIAGGSTMRVHIGKAISEANPDGRYFMLMAGIGLDASIVNAVNPRMKRMIGKAAFWYSGLEHLVSWKPQTFEVEVGGERFPATFAAVGKGSRYGGNLVVTPRARLDEPEFEICIINSESRLRFLYLLSHILGSGLEGDLVDVRFLRTTTARVHGNAPVQIDGELIGNLPMTFEIANFAIETIVPPYPAPALHLLPVNQAVRRSRTALGTSCTSSSV